MRENLMRELLVKGENTLGTRLWSFDPIMTEVVGSTGLYHYVELTAEYASYDMSHFENIVRAAELHGMASMIKIDLQNRFYTAQKAIGAGFQAILFADHTSPEEVAESIRAAKPMAPGDEGLFGMPTRRFIGMNHRATQQAHIQRLRETVLCFMIEKKQAVDRLEEILSVPGIDMVQFGPSDYSMSVGWNRSEHLPELREIEEHVIRAALAHGVRPRCEINSAGEAERYRALGVKDFSMGDEVRVLENYWKAQGKAIREMAPFR